MIRDATIDDYEQIARLHAENWQTTYRGVLSDDYLDNKVLQERLSSWRDRFTNPKPNQKTLVFVQDKEIVGFSGAFSNYDSKWGTYVDSLHVSSKCRGMGIGRKLLDQITQWAAGQSQTLFLWVIVQNEGATQFYQRLGASLEDIQNDVFPDGTVITAQRCVWTLPTTA